MVWTYKYLDFFRRLSDWCYAARFSRAADEVELGDHIDRPVYSDGDVIALSSGVLAVIHDPVKEYCGAEGTMATIYNSLR